MTSLMSTGLAICPFIPAFRHSVTFSENVMECLNAGMNGHIAKPVDIKLVIKEIRRIKEEKRS